jgi:hypothetical protein
LDWAAQRPAPKPPAPKARATQILEAFTAFHKENPHVWQLFERFTFDVIGQGYENYSSAAIFERIRWHMEIEVKDADCKLNNNFRAYYARMFHARHTKHDSFFHIRKRVSEERPAEDNDQQFFHAGDPGDESRLLQYLSTL